MLKFYMEVFQPKIQHISRGEQWHSTFLRIRTVYPIHMITLEFGYPISYPTNLLSRHQCVYFLTICPNVTYLSTLIEIQYKSLVTYKVDGQLVENSQNDVKIAMTASAMDVSAVDFLVGLGVPFIKVGSGDSNNIILLEKVAKISALNAVISTGMVDFHQAEKIYQLFKKSRYLLTLTYSSLSNKRFDQINVPRNKNPPN